MSLKLLKFYVNETYDAETETRPRRWECRDRDIRVAVYRDEADRPV